MTFTAIDELPLPPAQMVEDAKKDDLAEAHSLLPQLWTIREFRKIALPIVLGTKSKTGPIMREAIKITQEAKDKKIAEHKRNVWQTKGIEDFPFYKSIIRYTELTDRKADAALNLKMLQVRKFVAFKNGKVPKNRFNAGWNMWKMWKPTIADQPDWSFFAEKEATRPLSWLDRHNIPRDRAGLRKNTEEVFGDCYTYLPFKTFWGMMEWWKKEHKYNEPGMIDRHRWNRKVSCIIY
jgi:hypothetical protein